MNYPNGTHSNTTFVASGFLSNTNISVSTSLPSGLTVFNAPGTGLNLTAMQVFTQGAGSPHQSYRMEIIVGKQFETFDPATGQTPSGCETATTNDTWFCQGYGAASCTLSPCVRTYTSAVIAGLLEENQVLAVNGTGYNWGYTVSPSPPIPLDIPSDTPSSTTTSTAIPSMGANAYPQVYVPYIGMVDTTCLSADERQSLTSAGYDLDQNAKWLPYKLTFDPLDQSLNGSQPQNLSANASFPQSMLVHECLYAFINLFIYDLWEGYMIDLFTGIVKGDTGHDSLLGIITRINGSEALQTIYNFGNVSFDRVNQVFDNISDSMTDFFRLQTLPKYNNPAQGLVSRDQTCLGVRWPWLVFPATLVLLTLAFFVAILIESRPRTVAGTPVWKSTPLALLFHGLDLLDTREMDGDDVDRMEVLAREITIRLDNTDDGLKLVESAGPDRPKGE